MLHRGRILKHQILQMVAANRCSFLLTHMMQQTIDSVERGLLGLKKAGLEEILFIHLQGLIPVSAEKISGLIDVSGKTALGSDLCKYFTDEFKITIIKSIIVFLTFINFRNEGFPANWLTIVNQTSQQLRTTLKPNYLKEPTAGPDIWIFALKPIYDPAVHSFYTF